LRAAADSGREGDSGVREMSAGMQVRRIQVGQGAAVESGKEAGGRVREGVGHGAAAVLGTRKVRIWLRQGVVAELGKEAGGGFVEVIRQGAATELGMGRQRI